MTKCRMRGLRLVSDGRQEVTNVRNRPCFSLLAHHIPLFKALGMTVQKSVSNWELRVQFLLFTTPRGGLESGRYFARNFPVNERLFFSRLSGGPTATTYPRNRRHQGRDQ